MPTHVCILNSTYYSLRYISSKSRQSLMFSFPLCTDAKVHTMSRSCSWHPIETLFTQRVQQSMNEWLLYVAVGVFHPHAKTTSRYIIAQCNIRASRWQVESFIGRDTGRADQWLGQDNSIETFVPGGPKNYAHSLTKPNKNGVRTVCKVRGFTLNYRASQQLNFEQLKKMVLMCGGVRRHHVVESKDTEKKYRIVCTKRRRILDENSMPIDTFPFGKCKVIAWPSNSVMVNILVDRVPTCCNLFGLVCTGLFTAWVHNRSPFWRQSVSWTQHLRKPTTWWNGSWYCYLHRVMYRTSDIYNTLRATPEAIRTGRRAMYTVFFFHCLLIHSLFIIYDLVEFVPRQLSHHHHHERYTTNVKASLHHAYPRVR